MGYLGGNALFRLGEGGDGPGSGAPDLTEDMSMLTGAGAAGAAHARDGPGRAPLEIPHERTGVGMARHTVADQLTAVGVRDETCDDALLVLSELVSNAVTHAAPLPNGRIAVGWTLL